MIMINWGKIDSEKFEELAYDIISDIYPTIKWTPTQKTHDGNKDGECDFNAPLDVTIKYWYEAKYSTNVSSSIPKSHLDSTLVSCVLDGKVVFIAFITNAYISDDYQRRANIFSKQQDNLKIIYINGDEVENWLSDHPDIEYKYFGSHSAMYKDLENKIRNYCILQNYDVQGIQFAKASDLVINKNYILYLSFYSSCDQVVSVRSTNKAIELLPCENRKYDQFNNLVAHKGINLFYIPLNIAYNTERPVSFILSCNDGDYPFSICDMQFLDIYNPYIIHGSQIEIQQQLFSFINNRNNCNSIVYILAPAGYGKSYLLDSVYNNSLNPFSTYVVNFTGDELSDSLLCYKIIIMSLYGEIWDCLDDTTISMHFSEIENIMLQQIKSSQIITSSREQVIAYYQNNTSKLEVYNSQNQILIDDFHKLSKFNQKLISSFFNWFINQKMNCKIFVFSRPEIKLPVSTTCSFTISNIEYADIEATLKYNFKSLIQLPCLIRKYPIPLNILQFSNILSQIHDAENELKNKNEFETELMLNHIYNNSIQTANLVLGNKFLSEYKNNELVYTIYKIGSGISHTALSEFFGNGIYTKLYDLIEKRIVKESCEILLPFHDIYTATFDSYKSERLDANLELFVIFAEKNGYITKSKKFSVLIDIGKECLWKYRKEASTYRDELHKNAEYFSALEIAKMIKKCNKKNVTDYDTEDCQNQFVLANCIKYTCSYEKANKEFEQIKTVYESTRNREILGIYLESQTEIVNNNIWMLNIKESFSILNELKSVFEELYTNQQIVGHHLTYAFLNYHNRSMFVNYMIDEGSKFDFKKAIEYSEELKCKEYMAFAKMDYAKCLYDQNLDQAKELLIEAYNYFANANEKRRAFDAESELCFIDDLLNKKISYDRYLEIKKKMLNNSYIQSYIKIQLKLIILKLLFSNEDAKTIRDELNFVAINNSSISSGKRHQTFINHLYAATYYKENNFGKSREFSLKCLELMQEMGETYTHVHKNNISLSGYKGFSLVNNRRNYDSSFVLDIRVW